MTPNATRQPKSPSRRIVVIGGALSGPAAAARAREVNEHARITLLERNTKISYAVGGLAYRVSGEVGDSSALNTQGPEFFRRQFGIRARTRVEVTQIDPDEKVVVTAKERIPYDSLVYALGVESIVPRIPGIAGATNTHVFRNLTDLKHILDGLQQGRRVTVIGGGYFGLEAADGLLRGGAEVNLVEREASLLPGFSPEARYFALRALMDAGAAVSLETEVNRGFLGKGGAVRSLRLNDHARLETDLVLIAAGVRPRSQLLAAAGAALSEDGAVLINEDCATSLPYIYACGVCAHYPRTGLLGSRAIWSPQAAQADITAQVAGANAAGGSARLRGFSNSSILRLGDWAFAKVGRATMDSILVQAPSRDPYLPESQPLFVRLYTAHEDRVLVGAEVFGSDHSGVKQRIDLLTTALVGSLTLHDLAAVDFAYEAPFATARDAVNVAAGVGVAVAKFRIHHMGPRHFSGDPKSRAFVDVRSADRPLVPRFHQRVRRIPFEDLRGSIASLPKQKPIVFLSETGREGFLAARIAQQHGFQGVGFLEGGITAYPPGDLDFLRA